MANTFKLKTKAGVTTLATVYTVPSNKTEIVLGCVIGNLAQILVCLEI